MPNNNSTTFSFAQKAAEQPKQQLFSFSQYAPQKKQPTFSSPTEPTVNAANDLLMPDFGAPQSTPAYAVNEPGAAEGVAAGGKVLGRFIGDIAQGTAREGASLVTGAASGDLSTEVKPQGKLGEIIFGQQEPFSFSQEARQFSESFGLSEGAGTPILIALTALDWVTLPGKRKAIEKALVKAATADEAVKVLRNADLPDEVIFGLNLGERGKNVSSATQAEELLLDALEKSKKGMINAVDTAKARNIQMVEEPGVVFDNKPVFSVETDGLTNKEVVGFKGLDEARVQEYMDEIQAGGRPEPIRIQAADGNLYIEDGMHRVEALRRLGIETVEAIDVTKPSRSVDDVRKSIDEQIIRQAEIDRAGRETLPKEEIAALPKIERRTLENFPELGSADRLAELRSRTRGVITDEAARAKAAELGYTEDKILNLKEGTALNKEEKLALSGVIENARLNLKAIEDRLAKTTPNTPEASALRNDVAQQKIKMYRLLAVERGVAAEAGRALQAHRSTITAIEQQEKWLAKYLNDPEVPSDVKDYIYDKIGQFDGTPGEITRVLRELQKASKLEMFVEFATAAKLWATQTHLVNTISSLSRMLLNSPIYGVSGLINKLDTKLTGTARERFIDDAVAEIQGQMMGWRHAGDEALKALKDENYAFEARKLQDVQPRGAAIKGRPGKNELSDRIMNTFGKAVRTPFRILGVEDMLIRKPSEMGALYTAVNRRARMEGLKPGTDEWNEWVAAAIKDPVETFGADFMKEIQEIADGNLFQESLHPSLRKVQNWREDVPALKLVVPFFRTIVNLQKQALEFSPLAPVLPSVRKGLKAGGGARSDALAKMTLGTAAMTPLMFHAAEGNITLAPPTNPAERDKFYAEGKQPYSVKIGDKWYPYQRFSPYADWFVTSAAMAEMYTNDEEKEAAELASHAFFTLTQNFFDKSFATGMHDFLSAMADPERSEYWVQNFVTGATVPNIIPLAARVVDPVIRETDSLKEAYISKIPYLSKTLPAKRTVFGEEITRPGTAIERAISPVIPSPVAVDTVRSELDEIGYEMGFPGKTAGGFEMDKETYYIYQSVAGKVTYQALFNLIQTPQYQNMSPRAREQAVDKIVRKVREQVKMQVAQEQIIMSEIKNDLKNRGYSSTQAEEMAGKVYEKIKAKTEGINQ